MTLVFGVTLTHLKLLCNRAVTENSKDADVAMLPQAPSVKFALAAIIVKVTWHTGGGGGEGGGFGGG